MRTLDNTHACPGCGWPIARHLVVCSTCWRRVPKQIRARIGVRDRNRRRMPDDEAAQAAFQQAVNDAKVALRAVTR